MPRLLVLSLALAALVGPPTEALAWCRTTTQNSQADYRMCPSQGTPVAWAGGCMDYALDPRVLPSNLTESDLRATVTAAVATWNAASCSPSGARPSFRLLTGDDSALPVGYAPNGPNVNTVTFRRAWGLDSFHPPDAAAVTVVTFGAATAQILDADVEINLSTRFSVTGARDAADLQTIVTHEFGHVLGLAHSPEMTAVMWYSAGRGEQRRALTEDDLGGFCAIYPPSRASVCDPSARGQTFHGGGLTCATSAGSPSTAALPLGATLLALLALRRATAARRG